MLCIFDQYIICTVSVTIGTHRLKCTLFTYINIWRLNYVYVYIYITGAIAKSQSVTVRARVYGEFALYKDTLIKIPTLVNGIT